MPMERGRYPKDWKEIALRVKEDAGWKCESCGKQCRRPGEPFHYEVVRGKVVGIFRGGYTEYQVSTTNRKGRNSILLYLRTGMYGKTYFGTEREAMAFAEKRTDVYEKIWGEKLPRPWRKEEDGERPDHPKGGDGQ